MKDRPIIEPKPDKEGTDWVSFWRDREESARLVIDVSTQVAAERLTKKFEIGPSHDVLDFGCGPAFLCDHLYRRGVKIAGADINEVLIAENRRKYPEIKFVLISNSFEITEQTLAREFGSRRFDHIILLSVVQYFGHVDELDRMIGLLATFLKKRGKLIIADVVDSSTSPVADAMAAFFHAVGRGKVFVFLDFARQLMGKNYRATASSHQLLKVEVVDMGRIADRRGLTMTSHKNLTVHPTRKTYSFEY